ncbi:MAG: BMP family ABC transporter substrate-binding protein [Acidimicrobiales bacterium]
MLHIGFIYDGAVNDGAWSQLWDTFGRQYIEQTFGNKVTVNFKQNVPEDPTAAQAAQSLIQSGDTLIFPASAGYNTYLEPVAKAHPNVMFDEFETTYIGPNYKDMDVNIAQPAYVAGMMMAAACHCDTMGTVQPFAFPGLITVVNALELGAQAINPNIKLKVLFVSSFYDPAKETLAAKSLVSSGAGAISSSVDDPSVCVVAESDNVPCASEQLVNGPSFGPKTFLVSWWYVWKPAMKEIVGDVLAGKAPPDYLVDSWPQGGVGLGALGDNYNKLVPAADQAKIKAAETGLENGTFHVYKGPIEDQTGTVRIPAGTTWTAKQNLAMTWFVNGVIGSAKP